MSKTIVTVLRPTGEVEQVEIRGTITDQATRDRIYADTFAAGRGSILKWQVFTSDAPRGCLRYSAENGCPMHGETCR